MIDSDDHGEKWYWPSFMTKGQGVFNNCRTLVLHKNIPLHKRSSFFLLLGLNLFACAFYFYFLHIAGTLGHEERLMFSTSDAQEYLDYTRFIKGEIDYCNPNRPFFYPLLLVIFSGIGGITAIWIFQFLLWLAACNFSFLSVRRMGGGIAWSVITFLLPATYFSAICLTQHGLTEILIFFLLSVLTYVFSSGLSHVGKPGFGLKVILLLSLLFVTKPLFQIPMFMGILLFLIFYKRQIRQRPLILLWLLCCFLPALLQFGINKTYHGVFMSEQTTALNIRQYLANKVDYYEEYHDLEGFNYLSDSVYKARETRMNQKSMGEIWTYFGQHLPSVLLVMYDNLEQNIHGAHPYIDPVAHSDLSIQSWKMNGRFFDLHKWMFVLFFIYFIIVLFHGRNKEQFYFLSLGFISFMILLLNGITFWVGDRLAVPGMAVWCVLYPLFIQHIYRSVFTNENAVLHPLYMAVRDFMKQKIGAGKRIWLNKENY